MLKLPVSPIPQKNIPPPDGIIFGFFNTDRQLARCDRGT